LLAQLRRRPWLVPGLMFLVIGVSVLTTNRVGSLEFWAAVLLLIGAVLTPLGGEIGYTRERERSVGVNVRQVAVEGTDESWDRVTDDEDVRGVGADRIDVAGGWNVTVPVMEFVREEPLEGELRRRIAAALRSVEGVGTADEMDREVWFVTGTPSGEALVRAAAQVVDDLAGQTRDYL